MKSSRKAGTLRTTLALACILAFHLVNPSLGASQSRQSLNPTYEEFIALDSGTRLERLGRMSPEAISALKRTHAERWFAAHGSRLSDAQVSVFNEALAFITVELYARPPDEVSRKREEELTWKLTCVLGVENTRQAFVLHLPQEAPVRPGWRSTVDAWLSWFFDCVTP